MYYLFILSLLVPSLANATKTYVNPDRFEEACNETNPQDITRVSFRTPLDRDFEHEIRLTEKGILAYTDFQGGNITFNKEGEPCLNTKKDIICGNKLQNYTGEDIREEASGLITKRSYGKIFRYDEGSKALLIMPLMPDSRTADPDRGYIRVTNQCNSDKRCTLTVGMTPQGKDTVEGKIELTTNRGSQEKFDTSDLTYLNGKQCKVPNIAGHTVTVVDKKFTDVNHTPGKSTPGGSAPVAAANR